MKIQEDIPEKLINLELRQNAMCFSMNQKPNRSTANIYGVLPSNSKNVEKIILLIIYKCGVVWVKKRKMRFRN